MQLPDYSSVTRFTRATFPHKGRLNFTANATSSTEGAYHSRKARISRLRSKHITNALRSISRRLCRLYHESRKAFYITASKKPQIILLCGLAACSAVLRTRFPSGKASAGAICARSLTSKLVDSLRLIITRAKREYHVRRANISRRLAVYITLAKQAYHERYAFYITASQKPPVIQQTLRVPYHGFAEASGTEASCYVTMM